MNVTSARMKMIVHITTQLHVALPQEYRHKRIMKSGNLFPLQKSNKFTIMTLIQWLSCIWSGKLRALQKSLHLQNNIHGDNQQPIRHLLGAIQWSVAYWVKDHQVHLVCEVLGAQCHAAEAVHAGCHSPGASHRTVAAEYPTLSQHPRTPWSARPVYCSLLATHECNHMLSAEFRLCSAIINLIIYELWYRLVEIWNWNRNFQQLRSHHVFKVIIYCKNIF